MPGGAGRSSRNGDGRHDKNRGLEHRLGTNARPSSPRVGRCRQEPQELVREGPQNQSDLPHAQLVQPGRDPEVSHRRMLGSRVGHRDHPNGFASWNCKNRESF